MQVMAARERAESVYTHSPLLFILLRTLLHRAKRNLFPFKRFRTLCPKTPGEYDPQINRWPGAAAVGVSCLSNSLPVPRACIGRTIGVGGSHRQAILGSRFRRFRVRLFCVGGCDG